MGRPRPSSTRPVRARPTGTVSGWPVARTRAPARSPWVLPSGTPTRPAGVLATTSARTVSCAPSISRSSPTAASTPRASRCRPRSSASRPRTAGRAASRARESTVSSIMAAIARCTPGRGEGGTDAVEGRLDGGVDRGDLGVEPGTTAGDPGVGDDGEGAARRRSWGRGRPCRRDADARSRRPRRAPRRRPGRSPRRRRRSSRRARDRGRPRRCGARARSPPRRRARPAGRARRRNARARPLAESTSAC